MSGFLFTCERGLKVSASGNLCCSGNVIAYSVIF